MSLAGLDSLYWKLAKRLLHCNFTLFLPGPALDKKSSSILNPTPVFPQWGIIPVSQKWCRMTFHRGKRGWDGPQSRLHAQAVSVWCGRFSTWKRDARVLADMQRCEHSGTGGECCGVWAKHARAKQRDSTRVLMKGCFHPLEQTQGSKITE